MRFLVITTGIAIPVIFGYWRYQTTSEPNPVVQGLWIGSLSVFFSLGLWLSVTRIGRRLRYLTLLLILLGTIVHFVFAIYPVIFVPVVLTMEIYAMLSLFRRNSV